VTAPDAPQGAPVPNTRAEALTAEELVLQYQERFAQLRDALGDMIHEFGAGAGWRTEKQEAALEKALQVFLGRPVAERDNTPYWRLSAHVENALAPVLGYEYDEAVGWNVGEHTAESLVMAAASRIAELVEAVEAYFAAEDHLDATMDDRYEVSDTRTAAEAVIRRKDELRQALSRVRSEP
jgi:hypothetical protein